MLREALLVVVAVFATVVAGGEQCRAFGGLTTFTCPRPFFDDDDDIYCCDGDCCDDCWRSSVDTSACANIVKHAFNLGIGAIVGIAVGVIIIIVLIIVGLVCCCCACAKQQRNPPVVYQASPQGQQVNVVTQQGAYPAQPAQYPHPAGMPEQKGYPGPPPPYPPAGAMYPPAGAPYPQGGAPYPADAAYPPQKA